MDSLHTTLALLKEAARHPRATVAKSMADSGKKAVGCFPVYVPEEIIHAAGLLPVGLWGGQAPVNKADAYMQSFGCSVVKANLEMAIKGTYSMLSAIVVTAFCDTLKCAGLDLKVILPDMPVIPLVYAQNRQNPEGATFLKEEFEELAHRMEAISGKPVTEAALQHSLAIYEAYRAAMRDFVVAIRSYPKTIDPLTRHLVIKAAWFMDKEAYTAHINTILAALKSMPVEEATGLRVVVSGIMTEPEELLEAFGENGMVFVADDLAHASRQFRTPAPAGATAMERLVKRVQAQRGCSLLYDNGKSKGQFLIELMQESGAQALVVCMLKFCDPEGYDYPLAKQEVERAGYKLLYVEVEQRMESLGQVRTRIQSFAEMF